MKLLHHSYSTNGVRPPATRFPGRRLEFDSASMRFTNMPEANALLRPEWTDAALSEWGSYL